MSFARFLRQLFGAFFKWWWAAITGVASILSWLGAPETRLTIPRPFVAIIIFLVLALIFFATTSIAQSYRWFIQSEVHPTIVRVVPGKANEQTIFVINARDRPLAAGTLLAVHRDVAGKEVCCAILRLNRARQDGGGDQCEAIWISDGHLRDLTQGKVSLASLHVRRDIPADVLDQLRSS